MGNIINKQGQISGMGCSSCADKIRQTLISQDGVLEVDINFLQETASIKFNIEKTNEEILISVVQDLGYGLHFDTQLHDTNETYHSSHPESQNHNGNEQHGKESHSHNFVCPMKCEGEKVYDSPGNCPICTMPLFLP